MTVVNLQALHHVALTRWHRPRHAIAIAIALFAAAASQTIAQTARTAQPPLVIASTAGRDLYQFYCASCHGRDGKGAGPVVPALKREPPDLTLLANHNGGVFPRARVEAIVVGRADPPLAVHGTRDMPVWGPIFNGLDRDEALNRQRIANIVDYLASLQVRYAASSTTASRRGRSSARGRACRGGPRFGATPALM